MLKLDPLFVFVEGGDMWLDGQERGFLSFIESWDYIGKQLKASEQEREIYYLAAMQDWLKFYQKLVGNKKNEP